MIGCKFKMFSFSRRARVCARVHFFQAALFGSLSLGEVGSGSDSIVLDMSSAAPRKSRKVGALDLSNNASSSELAS